MNKTININLGGVFFHIDEDAYTILKKYLESIRKSLSDDPQGKDEIIKDIESRIGEILSESITDVRQVVNEQDIDDIIIIMGKPEEYAGDEEFFEDENYSSKSNKKRNSKKLFRDSDDKFLGGVSSGIAHYIKIDVIWVRLLWLLLMYKGTGVIIYVILWILLPETKSTSDKLQMEGEDVNISSIQRKIKESLNDASQVLKDGIDDVTASVKEGNYQTKVRSGLQEIIDLVAKVFTTIFKVTGKFVGVLLIVASVIALFTVIAGGLSLGSIEALGLTDELTRFPPFFYTSSLPSWALVSFGFVLIGIPFIYLFKLGLKIISNNVSHFTKITNLSLFGVWLLAAMGFAFAGIEYGAHSANKYSKSERFVIENIKSTDSLSIKMIALDEFSPKHYYDEKTVIIDGNQMTYRTNIKLDIRESNTDELYLMTYKKANGISIDKAKQLTAKIDYKFEMINNTLMLNAYFLGNIEDIYASQYLRMTLYVPKGMTIYFDKSTKYFLNDVDNVQDIYDRDMVRHYFIMNDKGLDCLDCDSGRNEKKETETNVDRPVTTSTEKKQTLARKTINPDDDPEEVAKKVKQNIEARRKENND